jgi:hypothetical protein
MINFNGATFGLITIGGVSYVKGEDGKLREATPDEIGAAAKASAERRAARLAARVERKALGIDGPDISIGDVAGGDIIKINIDRR